MQTHASIQQALKRKTEIYQIDKKALLSGELNPTLLVERAVTNPLDQLVNYITCGIMM